MRAPRFWEVRLELERDAVPPLDVAAPSAPAAIRAAAAAAFHGVPHQRVLRAEVSEHSPSPVRA